MQAAKEVKVYLFFPKVVHFSFDFAQQIHFPNSPQQVGPLYFLTPVSVNYLEFTLKEMPNKLII